MTKSMRVIIGLLLAPWALPAQTRTVTLEDAIALALRTQPAIIQAEGDLDVAYAGRRSAIGNFLPTVSASSRMNTGSPTRPDQTSGQVVNSGQRISYSSGLNASLVIFDGFSRFAETRAAGASIASADASLTDQKFQVMLQTKQAFFGALAASELVRVSETRIARAAQQLKISKDKLAAGSAIRSDTLRATVELGNAQLQLLNAQATQATQEANLARLIGVDGRVSASGEPELLDIAALDTLTLRLEVVQASPSVRAAEAQARASGSQVAVSRAQYFPTVSANYGQSWAGARENASLAPAAVTTWPSLANTWSFSLSLSWPIFNGFDRETNVSRSLASRNAAEARAADARRQANASFTQQLASLQAASARLGIAQTSRAAAEEDLRVQQERYRLGAATIVEVLTSQVSLDQAEVDLVQARLDVMLAKAQIEALLGREL